MTLYCKLIIPISILITTQYGTAFVSRRQVQRIRIHLDEDEALVLPNYFSVRPVKVVYPVTSNKFYSELSKINKKPSKYVKHTPPGKLMSSLVSDDQKNCCENEWGTLDVDDSNKEELELPLEEIIRPVSLTSPQIHLDENFKEIKPVTELIKDDLKYDFRTKTHSI